MEPQTRHVFSKKIRKVESRKSYVGSVVVPSARMQLNMSYLGPLLAASKTFFKSMQYADYKSVNIVLGRKKKAIGATSNRQRGRFWDQG